MFGRLVHRLERRLHARTNNRQVRPFEWGLEWLGLNDVSELDAYVQKALASSESFFDYAPVQDYRFDGERVQFTSPVSSPFPENNTVHEIGRASCRERV